MWQCLIIELLASLTEKVELKEIIAKHNKNDLIDNHGKGAACPPSLSLRRGGRGGKFSQIDEALGRYRFSIVVRR